MRLFVPCLVYSMVAATATVYAVPTVTVGVHPLLPNTAGQLVQIYVTGGDAVAGVNFNAQIDDGGSAAGGLDIGPVMTDCDLLTGTIFAGNNNGGDRLLAFPQLYAGDVLSHAGTVNADGLLATLMIDTTSVYSGSYSLRLSDTLNGPTDFLGTSAAFASEPGVLTIIPEPTTMTLALMVGATSILRRVKWCGVGA